MVTAVPSRRRCVRASREGQHVPDVLHPGHPHQQALEAEAEAGVRHRAILTQLAVPPVGGRIEPEGREALVEHVEPLLALAAADDLADARYEQIGGGDGLDALGGGVVEPHVERLLIGGVVRDEHRALKVLFSQEALVLGLQRAAGTDGEFEGAALRDGVDQDALRLVPGDAGEGAADDVLHGLDDAGLDALVEEVEVIRALLHHAAGDDLDEGLRERDVVVEIGEGDLWLDHPELRRVARRVAVLGAEGGAEGVDVGEGLAEVLDRQLAGDREEGWLSEERPSLVSLVACTSNISPAPSASDAVMIGV
jgi:hypothetical protein